MNEMKILNNYHTHTKYCGHAHGEVDDYVEQAIKHGLKILGFSDHGNLPDTYFTFTIKSHSLDYRNDVLAAKEKYKNTIKIYCGLEMDYFPEYNDYYKELLSSFDYLTLSCHYFELGNKDNWHSFGSYNLSTTEAINEYKDLVIKGLKTHLFTFCNHPDIYLSNWDKVSRLAAEEIINCALEEDIPLELNGGQFNRYDSYKTGKSRYHFWKLVGKKHAKVIINSDAHIPADVIRNNLDDMIKFCKELKLNVITELEIKHDYHN